MLPKAFKSCPKSNKSPDLVTLFPLHKFLPLTVELDVLNVVNLLNPIHVCFSGHGLRRKGCPRLHPSKLYPCFRRRTHQSQLKMNFPFFRKTSIRFVRNLKTSNLSTPILLSDCVLWINKMRIPSKKKFFLTQLVLLVNFNYPHCTLTIQ